MQITDRAKRWSRRIGRAGENTAARMLVSRGFEIVLRNCRTPRAEIDIIARDGVTLVFVEVKTLFRRRKRPFRFRPMDNLSLHQKQRIVRGAGYYLRALGSPAIPIRFDVVEVILSPFGPEAVFHHPDAFRRDSVFRRRPAFF